MENNPQSVLFLARLYHPHVGGVEKHLAKLCATLPSNTYTCTVLTEQYQPGLPLDEVIDGVKILRIPFPATQTKLKLWSWIWAHRQLFWQADIIHIHDVFWWMLWLSPWLKSKTAITFHGYEGSEAPKWNQRLWHQMAALMTRGSIGIGGFHPKWYRVKPDVVSFGAVDPVSKKQPTPKPNTIIFLGRLAEDTGIMIYLAGLRLALADNPHWQLDVYGEGPQLAKAKKYVAKHSLPVTFYGFVAGAADQLPKYQVAFISRHLAILEGLSVNTPIVAQYNNQIKRDYLELSPFKDWISIVGSASEVATALNSNPLPPKTAQTWAQAQTWSKMADNYQTVWEQLK